MRDVPNWRTLRALDLFAGLGGWTRPLLDRGHQVTTLDFDVRFNVDFVRDIMSVQSLADLEGSGGRFDLVLASPPCQAFSLLTVWRNWRKADGRHLPISDKAREGIAICDTLSNSSSSTDRSTTSSRIRAA